MKTHAKTPSSLPQLEEWIRQGQFDRVVRALQQICFKPVARHEALIIANFARRVGRAEWAVRVLNPIVRAEAHSPLEPATEPERLEYAEALRKLGAVREARTMLEALDEGLNPQTLLFRALSYFSEWNYNAALPLLKRYIETPSLIDYQRLVGRLNLAAAFLHERSFESASPCLASIREEAKAGEFSLIYGNSLELSAQLAIFQEDFATARTHLDLSEKLLCNASAVDRLWVKKWRAIAECLQANRVLPALRDVSEQASVAGHWETVRHCALYDARILRDAPALARVYAGTPYSSYRATILKETESWFTPPDVYYLSETDSPERILDSSSGTFEDGTPLLSAGRVPHRLMALLARDFYRPQPLVATFAQLFPEEHFDAIHSPTRVHQAVRKLRIALKPTSIKIGEANGAYRLITGRMTALRLRVEAPPLVARELQMIHLLDQIGAAPFSASEASRKLNLSVSSVQRLVRWGVETHHLQMIASGKKTRYAKIA